MIRKLWGASIIRYFIVAVFGVGLELALFVGMNTGLGLSYLIATPASTAFVIFVNWYLSRKVVFKNSRHGIHKELFLVVLVSVIGIGIQLAVTVAVVEGLKLHPLLGKMAAICITFFWNYWARQRYIFPKESATTANSGESL